METEQTTQGTTEQVAPTEQPQVVNNENQQTQVIEEPKERKEFIEKFNKLNKKEREIEQKRAEILEKEKRLARYEELEASKDPLKVLEAYGVTIEDVVNKVMDEKNKDTPEYQIKTLKEQLDEIKREKQREIEAKKKAEEEAEMTRIHNEKKAYLEESVKYINNKIKDAIDNSETAEILKSLKDYNTVFDTVLEVVKMNPESFKTKEDVEKIIPQAISTIEEQYEQRLELLKEANKVKKKFGLLKDDDQKQKTETNGQDKKPLFSKTLTNSMPAQQTKSESSGKLLNREDSLRSAAAFLRNELLKQKQ